MEDDPEALARLAALFGTGPVAALADGLRQSLEEILTLGDGPAILLAAHRIAGAAGSLGFAATGEAWRAVSLGDSEALPRARQLSRAAIATILSHDYDAEPNT
ncbi:hypothetical protein GCM10011380_17610 [Sphingomonas metalli]|uniref:HPt domain-containing protein n=1 Tax=Sphingomonas metalli TaxID=1779358 RepID=A0A916T336_9SPHN|nr:Hpt domain-containing protein [Sphingomonas metalli]GGB28469.1 hypothetical protein GCM10011380_17610 [Sphingomonas metalli]